MSLEELKKKKMQELQEKILQEQNQALQEQVQLNQQISFLENFVKQHLTKEAIQRYGNLKSAHPELAIKVLALIAQSIQTGNIADKIDDQSFKYFLTQIRKGKKGINIVRK